MIPRSVSASSLATAEECLARYKATAIDYAADENNPAAKLGTACHGAIEKYTDPILMNAKVWDWNFLIACYNASYQEVFGSDMEMYRDGFDILRGWHNRTDQQSDIQDSTILSREVKESFMVPYVLDGVKKEVKLNYIIDRLDEIEPGVYRVVDYKSQRSPLSGSDMRSAIQPRIYALAIQIKYPNAREIHVQYDFLRYERVGIVFTREDNIKTWRWLMWAVQRIVNTPYDNPPETLNTNCKYCIRKISCKTLKSNVDAGGVYGYSFDELAVQYYDIKSKLDGLASAADQAEVQLLKYMSEFDVLELDTDQATVKVTSRKTRRVDRVRLESIVGPEILKDYPNAGVSDIDKIREDPRLSLSQASLMGAVIVYHRSDPTIKIVKKPSW